MEDKGVKRYKVKRRSCLEGKGGRDEEIRIHFCGSVTCLTSTLVKHELITKITLSIMTNFTQEL